MSAYVSALRFLAQRRLTEAQLWQRLDRKGFAESAIREAVERVRRDGFLDDKLYAKLYVEGWPAWSELDLVGREITVGHAARLKVVKRIQRCAATDVDPATGIRDLAIPQTLLRAFGHTDCGIYGEVVAGGAIRPGRSR